MGFAGVEGRTAVGTGALGRRSGWGVTGKFSWFLVTNARSISEEGALTAALGGGTGGFQGEFGGRFLLGVRGYFTDWQGPFLRVGIDADLGRFFYSYVRLPLGELGYEYIRNGLAFDIGATAAYATSGSFGVYHDGDRDLGGSPITGAYSWLAADPVYTRVEWQHVLPPRGGPGSTLPVDVLQTSGCVGHKLGQWPLMACLDMGWFDGLSLRPGTGELVSTRGLSATLSIGLGGVGASAQAPGATGR
jgi:hypothetical protein